MLKKHAKRGGPWAQFALALKYEIGTSLVLSYEDARLWYTKAARQNHPDALHNLGVLYKLGVVGGRVDLGKARDLILSAMDIDPESNKAYVESLVNVAAHFLDDDVGGVKPALDILIPLAGTDPETSDASKSARFGMGYALDCEGKIEAAYEWCVSTVAASTMTNDGVGLIGESLSATSAFNAML